MKRIETCITPDGNFIYGLHKPAYSVTNLRQTRNLARLGLTTNGRPVYNEQNYPEHHVEVEQSDWIYEIPNPFPFKGRTFIDKEWADNSANNPNKISLKQTDPLSLSTILDNSGIDRQFISQLPTPLLLALATCSTDPEDLKILARLSCEIITDNHRACGLLYKNNKPVIHDHDLFETVANNPHRPDSYKTAMVLLPGAQGKSEIVGEWPPQNGSHVYEYLRRNSYIPGGHYAANMSEDAPRYSVNDLSKNDIKGLRHLYYQRSFIRLAQELNLDIPADKRVLNEDELEILRTKIYEKTNSINTTFATLWGWNFGFDYAPSGYRLHASHQQIHQQYALVTETVAACNSTSTEPDDQMPTYSCGDMITDIIEDYHLTRNSDFFSDYRAAIFSNKRMDGRLDLEAELTVWYDNRVLLFVPKAQTSQWELQLMTLPAPDGTLAGNIFECDKKMRHSLDLGILTAQKIFALLGAKMITTIEYSKRLGEKRTAQQPLIYTFLPKLPQSPGAFSEAQLRFINGHYPEDFAIVCRKQLARVSPEIF